MVELEELEMRILSQLEEAGAEHATSMLNTVLDPSGDIAELLNYQLALRQLLENGLIVIHMESMPTGSAKQTSEQAVSEIASITVNFKFSGSDAHWSDSRENGPPYFQKPLPEIVVTDAGYKRSVEILEARGYQWWRNKAK